MTSVRADDWDRINQSMMEEDGDPDDQDCDKRDGWNPLEDDVLAESKNGQREDKGRCNLN